ncbi:MAG: hypothetical protein IIB03_03370 [Acidobacteria bacterium]|nr:hypothetical protein [Acidobacteriota bacterium]
MALDLAKFTEQLKNQLADLSKQRAEIQKELEAVQLIQRASQRADSLPLKQVQETPLSDLEQASVLPEAAQPEETTMQEEASATEENPTEEEITQPTAVVVNEVVNEAVEAEEVAEPIEAAVAEAVAEPIEAAVLEAVAEPVEAAVLEAVAEPVEAAVAEEVAVAAAPDQPEATSPENTAEVEVRRTQLEETVMGLELNDEVAVLELLKMFQKPLSPGKIAEELVAVHWNFQGQHPRAAVNAALHKMVNQGRVKQVNGGDYGLSI